MRMVDTATLDGLLKQAIIDKTAEPAFLRALLDAKVYAHVPRHDRNTRVRFIQFTTPDGLTVLPFFSDETQARQAAGTAASIVVLSGRQLLEATRGATLMLNPNTARCTLYPEEIAALLDSGAVAIVERASSGDTPLDIGPVQEPPVWLADRLSALYAGMPMVEAAYLAAVGRIEDKEQQGLLVVVAVFENDAERVARASLTALQADCEAKQVALDLTTVVPDALPNWLTDSNLAPFYVRVHRDYRLSDAPGLH